MEYLKKMDKEQVVQTLSNLKESRLFLGSLGVSALAFGGLLAIRNVIQGGWYDRMAQMIQTDLTGKTVLITGGNSGIGLETAKQFAKLNCNVIITVRSDAKGQKATKEISQVLLKIFY